MRNNKWILSAGVVVIMVLLGGCNLPLNDDQSSSDNYAEMTEPAATPEPAAADEEVQPTTAGEDAPQAELLQRVSFDQLGITLEVPAGLVVQKDPMVSFDDPSRLESYLFYVQNYGYPAGPNSGDFQIYGILQYDLPPTTWDVFAENVLNSPMNAYATEIEVNGLRGFDTQLSGVRNRYVYQFLLEGQVLTLAVAEPTEENKALADQIISTMTYDPSKFSNVSKMQKVVEPGLLYELYIPDDWIYSFEPAAGVRISGLEAESGDAELVIEDSGGPHSNFLYKSGIFMSLVIQEGDELFMEPVMAETLRSGEFMFSGIMVSDYVFREPSTVEGEIRELRFYNNGLNYQLRFSYAESADQLLIDWILRNLQLPPAE